MRRSIGVALFCLAVVARVLGEDLTNDVASPPRAVVGLGLRPAPHFDPANPIVIESITNVSDTTVYHHVPFEGYDRWEMGPDVLVDGREPEAAPSPWGGSGPDMFFGQLRPLPPRNIREIVWRLRDQFQIPQAWTSLWVHTGPGTGFPFDALGEVWIVLDRSGSMVTQGMDVVEGTRNGVRARIKLTDAEPARFLERVELPEDGPAETAGKNAGHRTCVVGLAVAGGLVTLGLGVVLWHSRRHRPRGDRQRR